MTEWTPQQVLDLKLAKNDTDTITVRGYLVALLTKLWDDGDSFSGKRPFGNSGWQYELYVPLVREGAVAGVLDGNGEIDTFDEAKADRLILTAIEALGT